MKLHVVLPAKSKGSLGEGGKGGAKRSLKPVKSVLAEIDLHNIINQSRSSFLLFTEKTSATSLLKSFY